MTLQARDSFGDNSILGDNRSVSIQMYGGWMIQHFKFHNSLRESEKESEEKLPLRVLQAYVGNSFDEKHTQSLKRTTKESEKGRNAVEFACAGGRGTMESMPTL